MGYHQAGFTKIVGVDNRPQCRYPFTFVEGDALEFLSKYGEEFDAIHASPPCQAYSVLKYLARTEHHPRLVGETRSLLRHIGKPYVIENVVGAPLDTTLKLCGSMFGLATPCGAQLQRHRLFESNILLMSPGHCQHQRGPVICIAGDHPYDATKRKANSAARTIMVVGATPRNPALERMKYRTISVTGSTPQQNVVRNRIRETFPITSARIAMGIDWMVMRELSQAIPPAYTQFIGSQLLRALGRQ
jgi:DNA (cytosine-5)-methyltransferase 1